MVVEAYTGIKLGPLSHAHFRRPFLVKGGNFLHGSLNFHCFNLHNVKGSLHAPPRGTRGVVGVRFGLEFSMRTCLGGDVAPSVSSVAESKPPRFTTNLANLRAQAAAAAKINLSQLGQAKGRFSLCISPSKEKFIFLKCVFFHITFLIKFLGVSCSLAGMLCCQV